MHKEEQMSSMMPWEPSRDIVSLRDMMDRLFEDAFITPRGAITTRGGSELALDMYETNDAVVVKAALPGVKPEDVDITITGDTLTIRGETEQEKEDKEGNYLRRERRYGEYVRSITLPSGLQIDKADASFDNGELTLRIPKSEQARPKSIKVKPKEQGQSQRVGESQRSGGKPS
jgi:HSP20 family protein